MIFGSIKVCLMFGRNSVNVCVRVVVRDLLT